MLPSSSSAAMMGGGVPGKRVINFDKTTLDALDALQSELHRCANLPEYHKINRVLQSINRQLRNAK
jgi:hypothetical protein